MANRTHSQRVSRGSQAAHAWAAERLSAVPKDGLAAFGIPRFQTEDEFLAKVGGLAKALEAGPGVHKALASLRPESRQGLWRAALALAWKTDDYGVYLRASNRRERSALARARRRDWIKLEAALARVERITSEDDKIAALERTQAHRGAQPSTTPKIAAVNFGSTRTGSK